MTLFFKLCFCLASGTVARNKPLNRSACRPKWKSDVPISENQLRRKREEYWDTGEISFACMPYPVSMFRRKFILS
jgi:hypothetical protein